MKNGHSPETEGLRVRGALPASIAVGPFIRASGYARDPFADAVPAAWKKACSNGHALHYRINGQPKRAFGGTRTTGGGKEPLQ